MLKHGVFRSPTTLFNSPIRRCLAVHRFQSSFSHLSIWYCLVRIRKLRFGVWRPLCCSPVEAAPFPYIGNPNSASRAKIYPQTKMAARESGRNWWSTRIDILQNPMRRADWPVASSTQAKVDSTSSKLKPWHQFPVSENGKPAIRRLN